MIFVVISVLVVELVYGSSSSFIAFALPPDPGFGGLNCKFTGPPPVQSCCWREDVPPGTGNPDLGGDQEEYCQTCNLDQNGDPTVCTQKELQFFEARTPGLGVLPEDGVLDEPPAPPSGPAAPLQDGGVLQGPADQGAAPPLT